MKCIHVNVPVLYGFLHALRYLSDRRCVDSVKKHYTFRWLVERRWFWICHMYRDSLDGCWQHRYPSVIVAYLRENQRLLQSNSIRSHRFVPCVAFVSTMTFIAGCKWSPGHPGPRRHSTRRRTAGAAYGLQEALRSVPRPRPPPLTSRLPVLRPPRHITQASHGSRIRRPSHHRKLPSHSHADF